MIAETLSKDKSERIRHCLSKKIKRDATLDANLISGATYTEGEETKEFEVVKTKRFTVGLESGGRLFFK